MSATVDTLKIYERLKSAKLQDRAAKEIAEVLNDVIGTELATKRDIEALRAELKRDLEKTKAGIVKWVAGMLVAQGAVVAALVKLL